MPKNPSSRPSNKRTRSSPPCSCCSCFSPRYLETSKKSAKMCMHQMVSIQFQHWGVNNKQVRASFQQFQKSCRRIKRSEHWWWLIWRMTRAVKNVHLENIQFSVLASLVFIFEFRFNVGQLWLPFFGDGFSRANDVPNKCSGVLNFGWAQPMRIF